MKQLTKVFITVIHLILLAWILYVLSYGGGMRLKEVAFHFLGFSTLAFLIIRGTSYIEMKAFRKEMKRRHRK